MTVPKISQLNPGITVNIVLKADQRPGRLTTGTISEILTKGNHPRGIKVRLTNGQVGRVQSLSEPSNPSTIAQNADEHAFGQVQRDTGDGGTKQRKVNFQEDYREDPRPAESLSLAGYIKAPSSRKAASAKSNALDETIQHQLEIEFPLLDTALIAAILTDHDDLSAARNVLTSLT